MGICTSCCRPSDSTQNLVTPDPEVRRQQVLEAAERRRLEQESRGVKDVDKVKRAQQRKEETERRQEEAERASGHGGGLKWQVD
ncbi:small VCP/p97-interacting protein [Neocloeon triangulifer]|uniref:small VCP/p97-interacting protein n=1 Tax=Neocloeon triangulifer TaxID=2078957 RepID=UPI00286EF2C9|nr:small VCP/p97-interacting protein [Neocloeon triangulifer]